MSDATMNYYNEFDPHAAAWLRELVIRGLIPNGNVDSRDIRDVKPSELAGYTQCHFFAGIGGWPLALSLAGWPADRPAWTGSCPCQPFSAAGKRKGTADDRHLWPDFARLIAECAPPIVIGEQVASRDGREWLASVRDDLEAMGYEVGAADLCAPGAGAYHIRQRLFFGAGRLANASGERHDGRGTSQAGDGGWRSFGEADGSSIVGGGMGNADNAGPQRRNGGRDGADEWLARAPGVASGLGVPKIADMRRHSRNPRSPASGNVQAPRATNGYAVGGSSPDGRLAYTNGGNARAEREQRGGQYRQQPQDDRVDWRSAEWIDCTDGKARPIEPGTFPLAHGIPGRVGRLRGYGNAIVPQVAAAFVKAFAESIAQ